MKNRWAWSAVSLKGFCVSWTCLCQLRDCNACDEHGMGIQVSSQARQHSLLLWTTPSTWWSCSEWVFQNNGFLKSLFYSPSSPSQEKINRNLLYSVSTIPNSFQVNSPFLLTQVNLKRLHQKQSKLSNMWMQQQREKQKKRRNKGKQAGPNQDHFFPSTHHKM